MAAKAANVTATTNADKRRILPGLDGLRGVAILLVMFFHLAQMKPVSRIDPIFYKLTSYGWSGVDLFFVLSGFLITGILIDAKGTENYFRNFYARRALRILPLYYGFFAVLPFLVPLMGGQAARDAQVLHENQWWVWTHTVNWLTALTGDFHTATPLSVGGWWSLSIEEQFYLLWPAVILLVPGRKLLRVCLALIVASMLIRFAMAATGASWTAIYSVTFARMDGIAMGAAIAAVARSKNGLGNVKNLPLIVALLAVAGLVGVDFLSGTVYRLSGSFKLAVECTLFAWLWGALLVSTLVAAEGSPLQRLTHLKILRLFGRLSFGLYLFHMNMNPIFTKIGFDSDNGHTVKGSTLPWQALYLAAAISASLLCAYSSWHLYEKRFLKLKRFFPAGRSETGRQPPAAADAPGNDAVDAPDDSATAPAVNPRG